MKENVGRIERIVRIVAGAGAIAASLSQLRRRPLLAVLGTVAGVLVTESAITRVCPVNAALGIDSRSSTERMADFRTEINNESDHIQATYAKTSPLDDHTHS